MRGSVLLLNQRQWKRGFRPQGRARAGLGGDSRSSPGARCSWRRSWAQLRVTLTATKIFPLPTSPVPFPLLRWAEG